MAGLGVGIRYDHSLAGFVATHGHAIDFVSVSPERLWIDHGAGAPRRFVPVPQEVAALDMLADRFPLIARGAGLSIAPPSAVDEAQLGQLARWCGRYDFRWVGAQVGGTHALPRMWDHERLERVVEGVRATQRLLDRRVLLEHDSVAAPTTEAGELIHRLCSGTGCGVLLELGSASSPYRDDLELANVHEIHVGGDRAHTDVWRTLDRVVPRCPNLRAITFELGEPLRDDAGIVAQLAMARGLWQQHHGRAVDVCAAACYERER